MTTVIPNDRAAWNALAKRIQNAPNASTHKGFIFLYDADGKIETLGTRPVVQLFKAREDGLDVLAVADRIWEEEIRRRPARPEPMPPRRETNLLQYCTEAPA